MKSGTKKKATRAEVSSGNVFADLQLPDADELLAKSKVITRIFGIVKQQSLTEDDAARRIGIAPADLAAMLRGDLDRYPQSELERFEHRLMRSLRSSDNGQGGTKS